MCSAAGHSSVSEANATAICSMLSRLWGTAELQNAANQGMFFAHCYLQHAEQVLEHGRNAACRM